MTMTGTPRWLTLERTLSCIVMLAVLIYAISFLDPYVALIITPLFALGCARGKHPLTLLALASIPALVLIAVSSVKLFLTGLPLVTYDHYFLRQNVLLLAYNDWRVATGLVIGIVGLLFYIRGLFAGRGSFTRFEKGSLVAFSVACLLCVRSAQGFADKVFDWSEQLNTPTIQAFVMSSQIPGPELHTLYPANATPPAIGAGLKPPTGHLPDIFFVLQESTFPPNVVRPGYEPRWLFARTAPHSGPLHVHTFAGGTWKTEFSVVTQMRPQEFGSDGLYVFHQLAGRINHSIFTLLKTLGYRTMVFYPVPGTFLNARSFYGSIGVDEFYDPEALGLGKGWEWNIPDSAFYQAMVKKVADSDRPVVAFMLTINQHGPHNNDDPISDYVTRFEASDAAYGAFLDTLSRRGRKAGVVTFGDHQPEFMARFQDNHARWYFTAYDMRCVNFECIRTSLTDRGARPVDSVMLASMALEGFGFTLDTFSDLQRTVFKGCDDDITRCDETARLTYNTAFAKYFNQDDATRLAN